MRAYRYVLIVLAGCAGLTPAAEETASVGHTSSGFLRHGVGLPLDGVGYELARPGDPTRFGTEETIGAIERAVASVASRYAGSFPMRIGDIASPDGGQHPRHRSHRSGRDIDVIFYAADAAGRSVQGRGWLAYDRFGIARESRSPSGAAAGDLFFFDAARNWHFVRELLMDPQANVQWVFCSRGVKARLLEYAAAHESDPEAIFRATWALHQPSNGNPHADHFHVRFACPARQRTLGCQDRGYLWPWIRPAVEKAVFGAVEPPLSDDAIVHALLSDDAALTESAAPPSE